MSRKNYGVKKKTVAKIADSHNVFSALSDMFSDTDSDSDNNSNDNSDNETHEKDDVKHTKKSHRTNRRRETSKTAHKSPKNSKPNPETSLEKTTKVVSDSNGCGSGGGSGSSDVSNEDTKKKYVVPDNDGWSVAHKKKKWKPREDKKLFAEENYSAEELVNMGNSAQLNNKWNVSLHNVNKTDWTLESYDDVYSMSNIGEFWRLFNNFPSLDKMNNHVFIMRDGITPIWEDVNNRKGGICSIKMEFLNKGGINDMGSEIMTCICALLVNESLVRNNMCVNGISYSIKNRSIIIKLWVKDYSENASFKNKLPLHFLHNIDTVLERCDTNKRYNRSTHSGSGSEKVSIRYSPIVPEDET
jgi:hypothetical protein